MSPRSFIYSPSVPTANGLFSKHSRPAILILRQFLLKVEKLEPLLRHLTRTITLRYHLRAAGSTFNLTIRTCIVFRDRLKVGVKPNHRRQLTFLNPRACFSKTRRFPVMAD